MARYALHPRRDRHDRVGERSRAPRHPELAQNGLWLDYVGATLTAKAFDTAWDGFGKWLVTIACWLFAYSTMISWIYYGEQGVIYLFGARLRHGRSGS